LQPQLQTIVARVERREVSELLCGVFSDLNRLLGYLDGVGAALHTDESASQAVFLFDVVRSEGTAAACGIEQECAGLELPGELAEELERIGFALRHECRVVFERILPGVADSGEARPRLKDAHDLLRNCFQQSTISLARVFDPGLDGAQLFNDLRVKRDTSLRLYEDLGALLRSARHALWRGDHAAQWLFAERFEDFRAGSMEYLMEKDCDACDEFYEEFARSREPRTQRAFLHRFSCYLEILHRHVGMRSVLADVAQEMAA
jgi:hypothetical protein